MTSKNQHKINSNFRNKVVFYRILILVVILTNNKTFKPIYKIQILQKLIINLIEIRF